MQNIITTPPPSDFEIDSFRIKIPYDLCTIYSTELEQLYLTINSNTSEIVNERLNNRINVGTEYMKLWIQVAYQNAKINSKLQNGNYTKTRVAPKKYIIVNIHSKLLKDRYLDRITMDNIESIYDSIMSYKQFYCDFHTFINSDVLDIDFCRNVVIDNWKSVAKYILEYVKPSKQTHKGINVFRKKDNVGMQFGQRDKGTKTLPYIKIYHKYLELTTRSKVFTDMYLDNAIHIDKNLFRVEYTLRDKKHYSYYGINNSQLVTFLNLNSVKKESIASHMFSLYFSDGIYSLKKSNRINVGTKYSEIGIQTPSDFYIYSMLRVLQDNVDFRVNLETIIHEMKGVGFSKPTFYRCRKDIYRILASLPEYTRDVIKMREIEYQLDLKRVQKSMEIIGINERHWFSNSPP